MKRGRKASNGISFVHHREMKPFIQDLKTHLKDLHLAMQLYEIELIEQGYTPSEASAKVVVECFRLKDEIMHEDAERMI